MLGGVLVGLGASRFSSRPPLSGPPAATSGTSVLPTPSADTEALVFASVADLSAGLYATVATLAALRGR